MLIKIRRLFEVEDMHTQYIVLRYRIDLYFHDYKIAIEIGENGYSDWNIDYKVREQKPKEQGLGCKIFRINTDFAIFRAIKEIFRHIKQLIKKP